MQPTLLTVFPSVAHGALTDVRVPLVDARASILAPVGFAIVPLRCTAWNSGRPSLCMVLIRKRLRMTFSITQMKNSSFYVKRRQDYYKFGFFPSLKIC